MESFLEIFPWAAGIGLLGVILWRFLGGRGPVRHSDSTDEGRRHGSAAAEPGDGGSEREWVIQRDDGLELVVFRELPKVPRGRRAGATQIGAGALGPLRDLIPQAIVDGVVASKAVKRVRVLVPEATRKLIQEGVLEMMPAEGGAGAFRGMVRGVANKKIDKHLVFVRELDKMAAFAGVRQLAAAATAQSYLVRIEASLERIEEGLESIRAFLDDEVIAEVEGQFSYLRDRAATLRSDPPEKDERRAVRTEVEAIEVSARGRTRLFIKRVERSAEVLGVEGKKAWLDGSEALEELEASIDEVVRLGSTAFGAIDVRLACLGLTSAMGGSSEYGERQLDAIEGDLEELEAALGAYEDAMRNRVRTHGARLQRKATDFGQRRQVMRKLRLAQNGLKAMRGRADIDGLRHALGREKVGGSMTIELEIRPDGSIGEVLRLEEGAQKRFPGLRRRAEGDSVKQERVATKGSRGS